MIAQERTGVIAQERTGEIAQERTGEIAQERTGEIAPGASCPGVGRDWHRVAPGEMSRDGRGGTGTYCRACANARERALYADPARRARRNAARRARARARRLGALRAYRRAARTRLGVVVGMVPRARTLPFARVAVEGGVVSAVCDPGTVGVGEFVRVVTRVPPDGSVDLGRRGARVCRRAHRLGAVDAATGERLLALQRAHLWAAMSEADREAAGSAARAFGGVDLFLARATTLARRERGREDEMDAGWGAACPD